MATDASEAISEASEVVRLSNLGAVARGVAERSETAGGFCFPGCAGCGDETVDAH